MTYWIVRGFSQDSEKTCILMIFAYKEEEGIKGKEEGRDGKVGGKIGFSHFDIKLIQVES